MINDGQIRLDEIEASYRRLRQSHAKLISDYQSLGGVVSESHLDGSVDPEDEKVHIVIEKPVFLTPKQVADDLCSSLIAELNRHIKKQ